MRSTLLIDFSVYNTVLLPLAQHIGTLDLQNLPCVLKILHM